MLCSSIKATGTQGTGPSMTEKHSRLTLVPVGLTQTRHRLDTALVLRHQAPTRHACGLTRHFLDRLAPF